MCVMEVRPGQHSSTIAQAMAHNVSTLERDAEMFRQVLVARGEDEMITALDRAQDLLTKAYAGLLEMFGEEVSREVTAWDSVLTHEHGNERVIPSTASLVAQAHHDATLARRFETR